MSANAAAPVPPTKVRLDKWLWAARFFKTRSLAAEAIGKGHVRIGGDRAKAAHGVSVGESIEITKRQEVFTVEVRALSDRRGGAEQARTLYRESEESIARREQQAAERRAANLPERGRVGARPSKRDRRRMEDALRKRLR